jgi:hypothetical protein
VREGAVSVAGSSFSDCSGSCGTSSGEQCIAAPRPYVRLAGWSISVFAAKLPPVAAMPGIADFPAMTCPANAAADGGENSRSLVKQGATRSWIDRLRRAEKFAAKITSLRDKERSLEKRRHEHDRSRGPGSAGSG